MLENSMLKQIMITEFKEEKWFNTKVKSQKIDGNILNR